MNHKIGFGTLIAGILSMGLSGCGDIFRPDTQEEFQRYNEGQHLEQMGRLYSKYYYKDMTPGQFEAYYNYRRQQVEQAYQAKYGGPPNPYFLHNR
jgi:hypothetical protein